MFPSLQGWGRGYDDCPEPPLITEDAGVSHEKPMEDADVRDVADPIDVSSEATLSDDVLHLTDEDE